jgi:filamentous hemagglutinin
VGKAEVSAAEVVSTTAAKSELSASGRGAPDTLQPEADFAGRGLVREDLSSHLTTASRSGKQISGGHEIDNFTTALNDAGGKVLSRAEKAPGIYEIEYQLPGATKSATKTVYDPALYPKMTEMANTVANKGLMQYQQTGDLSSTVVVEGIKFTVPIKIQKGTPYVPTVIPTGLAK